MQRILLAVFGLLPALVAAQTADVPDLSDYAFGFPITTEGTASFYAVELPLEVNRSVTDPELRDTGVFNGDGLPVPRTFAPASDEGETTERSSALPMLPLFAPANAEVSQLILKRDGAGTQFRFDLDDLLPPAEGERLAAYIVDARQAEAQATALDFVWTDVAPGFMGRLIVEGGNDLQNWDPAGAAVVADLREDQASIVQRRVHLRRADYNYLRVRWEGMPDNWRLSQVLGVYVAGGAQPVRKFVQLESTAIDAADSGRLFELGGAPMVDQVQLVLPVPNTVIAARVYYWSAAHERWVEAGQGSFHHIVRENNSVMSEPLVLRNTRTNRFKVVVTKGPADVVLQLEIGWRPDSLLFLAQGQTPFTLAAGNANDALAGFPLERTFGDPALAELARDNGGVGEATLAPRYVLGGPERLQVSQPTDWRKLALWLALLLGVAFVGFMAVKTIRELK
jgi:hypothetical protein